MTASRRRAIHSRCSSRRRAAASGSPPRGTASERRRSSSRRAICRCTDGLSSAQCMRVMTRACTAALLATILGLLPSCGREHAAPQPAQPKASSAPPDPVEQPAGDGNDAVAVVKAYYDAINAHDYRRAFALWGRSGPPQTFDEFEKGFADTASVSVTTGEPSRVEGAAGSRYIDVQVTITATKKSGERQTFTGTYTLRRTVVDGARPSERRWHLNGANIHASP